MKYKIGTTVCSILGACTLFVQTTVMPSESDKKTRISIWEGINELPHQLYDQISPHLIGLHDFLTAEKHVLTEDVSVFDTMRIYHSDIPRIEHFIPGAHENNTYNNKDQTSEFRKMYTRSAAMREMGICKNNTDILASHKDYWVVDTYNSEKHEIWQVHKINGACFTIATEKSGERLPINVKVDQVAPHAVYRNIVDNQLQPGLFYVTLYSDGKPPKTDLFSPTKKACSYAIYNNLLVYYASPYASSSPEEIRCVYKRREIACFDVTARGPLSYPIEINAISHDCQVALGSSSHHAFIMLPFKHVLLKYNLGDYGHIVRHGMSSNGQQIAIKNHEFRLNKSAGPIVCHVLQIKNHKIIEEEGTPLYDHYTAHEFQVLFNKAKAYRARAYLTKKQWILYTGLKEKYKKNNTIHNVWPTRFLSPSDNPKNNHENHHCPIL